VTSSPHPANISVLRLAAAKRFHLAGSWSSRIQVVELEQPTSDWSAGLRRAPTTDELEKFVALDSDPGGAELCLWNISPKLRDAWWAQAEAASEANLSELPLEGFVQQFAEFASFKGLPTPTPCRYDVSACPPGEKTVRSEADQGLIAAVNLSDEPAALVVSTAALPAVLAAGESPSRSTWERQRLEAARCALFGEARLIEVRLAPGEGFWLPAEGAVWDRHTQDRQEVDVWFLLRRVYS
jgi:hypothetical protein